MDNVIVKYSDFFQDDGGFEKIKSDFKDLGEFLIKEAKKVKSEANIIDIQNIAKLSEYEERTESLAKAFESYGKSKESINNIESEYLKTQKKLSRSQLNTTKALDKLNIELAQHKVALAAVNKLEKDGKISIEEATVARGKAKLLIKSITSEINKQEKELIDMTKLTKNEIKLIEAKAILQKNEANNINQIRERLSALRIVAAEVNITTQEGKDQVAAYNSEIDELTNTLSENSDQFIKNKINVGNYEESIVNALEGVNLFQGELGVLNGIMSKSIGFFKRSEKATNDDTKAKKLNLKAVFSLKNGMKLLNTAFKATGILLIVAAFASLAAAFSQGRAGAIKTGQVMQRLAITLKAAIEVGVAFFKFLGSLFSNIGQSFKNGFSGIKLFFLGIKEEFASLKESAANFGLGDFTNEDKKKLQDLRNEIKTLEAEKKKASDNNSYSDSWKKFSATIDQAKESYKNATAAIKEMDKALIEEFRLKDKIKQTEIDLIKQRTKVLFLEQDSVDASLSLAKQEAANNELIKEKIKLLRMEKSIAFDNLKIATAKARQDVIATGQAGKFSNINNDAVFAKELLDVNRKLDPRDNPLSDEFLDAVTEARKTYLESLEQIKIAEDDFQDRQREIKLARFDTNVNVLLKDFESQRSLSEEFINDITKNFQDRLIEFENLRKSFIKVAQDEINELNKLSALNPDSPDFKFRVEFQDDGTFKLFNEQTEIATTNSKEMLEQLRAADLPDATIEKVQKLVDKTRDNVKTTIEYNKQLKLAKIALDELTSKVIIDKDQNDELEDLNRRISELRAQTPDFLDNRARKKILEQLEKLEKEKTEIEERGDYLRRQNRIKAIDEELKDVGVTSQRKQELLEERLALEKEIIDQSVEKNTTATKEQNEKAIAEYQKFIAELKNVFEEILDKISEISEKRVQTAEKEVDKQGELVDEQKRRAELGLTNTLAFEQKQLAEREAQLIKQRKRQERLEKIKALWTSYNAYAEKEENPNQAIFKAIRDFAILDAISATFGDGGLVADKVPIDSYGITRGRSHNGRGGGIPVLVEGGEGFFSGNEIKNLGRDNFYKIKHAASLGPIDSNFFSGQKDMLMSTQPIFVNNDKKIINELREVKQAIESKPTQLVDVPSVVDGVLKFTETIQEKNKTKRNHFKIKKPRL